MGVYFVKETSEAMRSDISDMTLTLRRGGGGTPRVFPLAALDNGTSTHRRRAELDLNYLGT